MTFGSVIGISQVQSACMALAIHSGMRVGLEVTRREFQPILIWLNVVLKHATLQAQVLDAHIRFLVVMNSPSVNWWVITSQWW